MTGSVLSIGSTDQQPGERYFAWLKRTDPDRLRRLSQAAARRGRLSSSAYHFTPADHRAGAAASVRSPRHRLPAPAQALDGSRKGGRTRGAQLAAQATARTGIADPSERERVRERERSRARRRALGLLQPRRPQRAWHLSEWAAFLNTLRPPAADFTLVEDLV